MYQPYLGGRRVPRSRRPPVPPSILKAVKLMYAGAVLSLIGAIAVIPDVLSKGTPAAHGQTVIRLGGDLIYALLWIITARASKDGMGQARIAGTVFFGLATVILPFSLAGHLSALIKIGVAADWLVGLGAVILFWQRGSSDFFRSTRVPGPGQPVLPPPPPGYNDRLLVKDPAPPSVPANRIATSSRDARAPA